MRTAKNIQQDYLYKTQKHYSALACVCVSVCERVCIIITCINVQMPVEKYHDTVDFKWNIEVKCWGVCVYVGVCGCVCVVCTLLFGLLVAVHAAKVTGRNTMMRTMTQTNTLKLREGETGRRCHGDDLLSATASHSSRLRSNWL